MSDEEKRPLRKSLNRIESDEEEEEDGMEKRPSRKMAGKQACRGITDCRELSVRAHTRGSRDSLLKHNGLLPQRSSAQDEDEEEDDEEEDDLSADTDFVNFVFDSEQLS